MKQPKPILHARDHLLGGADHLPGLGTGLPVPPWSVNYETGEVVGRTYDDSGNFPPPLTLEVLDPADGPSNNPDGLLYLHVTSDDLSTIVGQHVLIETTHNANNIEAFVVEIADTGNGGTLNGARYTLSGEGGAAVQALVAQVDGGEGTGAGLNSTVQVAGFGTAYGVQVQASAVDAQAYGAWLSASTSGTGVAYALFCAAGLVDLGLPGAAGVAGSLYVDGGGFVKVSP